MSYAIRKDGLGWREVLESGEVLEHETWSETLPATDSQCPDSVWSWQFARALTQMGWRDQFEQLVAAADQDTRDMWQRSPTIERYSPFVLSIADQMGKTSADVDSVFILAASIIQ
ncbi:hypothetical protein [Methylomonas koyamae]|uniref:hypothetical protein n=1 Tax=Methylomonas koyamae TaxID=702114 RepID=UPI00112CA6DB|nr:hypothetical protein [Methylomonas koyamae]TPQ24945.1 hypothetical protein C2U68_17365 [Methylomonas koyamae]